MSTLDNLFAKDVLLDDSAFQKASGDLRNLSQELEELRREIAGLLENLSAGFATPAGEKFLRSCTGNLLQPMTDLAAVLTHVSDNLTQAEHTYQSVFDEFASLNSAISRGF